MNPEEIKNLIETVISNNTKYYWVYVLLSGLFGLIVAYFFEFIKTKGKNLATRQDIEGLTLKVESIKQQFVEKNANLKAKLDLLTNLQINYKNDERSALIEFHKKLKRWMGILSETSPNLINDYDNEEIQGKIPIYNSAYEEVLSAQAILELYVEDKRLIEIILNLKMKVLEDLARIAPRTLADLKFNNLEIKGLEAIKDGNTKELKQKELFEKRKEIYSTHGSNIIEGLKNILKEDKEYKEYIKNYLKQIVKE